MLVALLMGALFTWPLLRDPVHQVLGQPSGEVAAHLWGLWAALRDGPLVIEGDLLDHPRGSSWVLADPLDLLWFLPGLALGGPVLGFNLVQFVNAVLFAFSAALLARVFAPGAPPWLAALAAGSSPVAASHLLTGHTEVGGMGWLGVALAALGLALREARPARALLAGLALGACVWSGVYVGLHAALAATAMVLARPSLLRLRQALLAAVTGLAVAAPVLRAVLEERAGSTPGGHSLVEVVLREPGHPDNVLLNADLAGLVWPLARGGAQDLHTVYLGVVLLALAVLGAWPRPRPWELLLPVVALFVGALGFFLTWNGRLVEIGGQRLLMPAGWLSMHLDLLGRAGRWYRALVPVALLLAPLAALGVARLTRRPLLRGALAASLIVDGLGRGALPWPRPAFAARPPEALLALDGAGALLELPVPTPSAPRPGQVFQRPLLWQAWTGRPMAGNPLQQVAPGAAADATQRDLGALANAVRVGDAATAAALRPRLAAAGFDWVVHVPDGTTTLSPQAVRLALGPPDVEDDRLWAWRLPGEE